MDTALDAVLEAFTWIGLGGALALAVVAVGLWAADGSWLAAEAIVDRDGAEPCVRWFDADGDANVAVLSARDDATLAGKDAATIWYRLGWHGRMRLTRRNPGLVRLWWATAGLLSLGVVSAVSAIVLLVVRG